MLRRLLIAFFILANLTTQASVAFACGMMDGAPAVQEHCCCPDVAAAPTRDESADGKGCCQKIVGIFVGPSDQIANLAAPAKLPAYDPQPLPPALVPALLAIALPAQSEEVTWDETSDHSLYGTDLYLRTQRLRL